jgi:hypothetical protein
MSYYAEECNDVGAFTVTPGATKLEMDTVDAGMRQLDGELRASQVSQAFVLAWQSFLAEWRRFQTEHSRWVDRLFDRTYFKTLEFRRRLRDWREAFVKAGGRPQAPALPGEPISTFPWERFAIVAGGVAAILGVVSFFSSLGDSTERSR